MKEKASYEQLQAWIRELEKRAGVQPSAIHDLEDVVDHLPGAVFRAQICDHGTRRFLLLSQGIKSRIIWPNCLPWSGRFWMPAAAPDTFVLDNRCPGGFKGGENDGSV